MHLGTPPTLSCLVLALAGLPGSASTWPPIPPEAWALGEDSARGFRDAVVLEKRTIFTNTLLETVYRVRIFSEAGQNAAALPRFSPDCHHVEGRIVNRDGRITQLRGPEDFRPVPNRPGLIIPRDLTADCVLEVRWQESTWRKYSAALPRRLGSFGEWRLGGPYATLVETLELAEGYKWRTHLLPGSRRPEVTQAGEFRILRFKDLPPLETPPFCFAPLADRPRFQVFDLPKVLFDRAAQGMEAFWKAVMVVPIPKLITRDRIASGSDRIMNTSRVYSDLAPSVKDRFQDFVHVGSAYKTLSRTLREGLPPSAGDRARELLVRLQTRITCDEAVSFDLDERDDTEEVDRSRMGPENLEETVRSGRTNAQGMQILLFRLLQDAGLKPRLALLADRRIREFNFDAPIAWQFTDALLGLEEPGHPTLWLDPVRKDLPPGAVAPGLQGASGLLVDPESWSFQVFSMPFQPEEANARRYQVRFAPEGGGLRFRAQGSLAGCAAYGARLRRQVPATSRPGADRGLAWEEEGVLAPARGVFRPFPGLRPFLPEGAPAATCAVPIVQAVNDLQEAVCILELPTGVNIEAPPALSHANAFGSVEWNLAFEPGKTGRQAILTCRIRAHALVAAPADYAQFLAFRAWVTEAEARTLTWVQP